MRLPQARELKAVFGQDLELLAGEGRPKRLKLAVVTLLVEPGHLLKRPEGQSVEPTVSRRDVARAQLGQKRGAKGRVDREGGRPSA